MAPPGTHDDAVYRPRLVTGPSHGNVVHAWALRRADERERIRERLQVFRVGIRGSPHQGAKACGSTRLGVSNQDAQTKASLRGAIAGIEEATGEGEAHREG